MSYKSKYFSDAELSCKCGCGLMPTEETIKLADKVREDWQAPVLCVSGARCAAHNTKVGGAPQSAHLDGLALDLMPADKKRIKEFQKWCAMRIDLWKAGMENPAHTKTWVHLQRRAPYSVFLP